MKGFILIIVCLLAAPSGLFGQTDATFDIATFKIPQGWKRQDKPGVVILSTSDQNKGAFALITLYESGQGSGNAAADFDREWQQFVAGQLGVKGKPETEPAKMADGWQIISGGSTFESEQGTSAVILTTFSGFGRAFSVAAIFNSQDNLAAIDGFLASINLKKPDRPAAVAVAGPVKNPLVGTWSMASGVAYRVGTEGVAGYIRSQYMFNPDGTYTFTAKTFQYSSPKLILIRENGTYQIDGTNVTVAPAKSVAQAWSKKDGTDKWGSLLSSQNRRLERVTYRYTMHYFSGIDQWNLVLQADKPTERDGPFSGNTTFSNAWYYTPISANEPLIELPG